MTFAISTYKLFSGNWIPDWLLAHRSELPRRLPEFYGIIARIIGKQGSARINRETLATRFGVETRRIDFYIKKCKDLGLLAVRHTGRASVYALLFHEWMSIPEDRALNHRIDWQEGTDQIRSKRGTEDALSDHDLKESIIEEKLASIPAIPIVIKDPTTDAPVSSPPLRVPAQPPIYAQGRSRTERTDRIISHTIPAISQFGFDICAAFAQAERDRGRPIVSIPALAHWLYTKGTQDKQIEYWMNAKSKSFANEITSPVPSQTASLVASALLNGADPSCPHCFGFGMHYADTPDAFIQNNLITCYCAESIGSNNVHPSV